MHKTRGAYHKCYGKATMGKKMERGLIDVNYFSR